MHEQPDELLTAACRSRYGVHISVAGVQAKLRRSLKHGQQFLDTTPCTECQLMLPLYCQCLTLLGLVVADSRTCKHSQALVLLHLSTNGAYRGRGDMGSCSKVAAHCWSLFSHSCMYGGMHPGPFGDVADVAFLRSKLCQSSTKQFGHCRVCFY